MDRRPALMGWRQRLETALRSEDWAAMQRADREIASGLPPLAAAGHWSANEQQALLELQLTHERARAECATALGALGARLEAMQSQRDGWLAYNSPAWEAR